jgi:cyanophycinase
VIGSVAAPHGLAPRYRRRSVRRSLTTACLAAWIAAIPLSGQEGLHPSDPAVGPAHGSLIVAGGGDLGREIWGRFVDLAGGEQARIVVIPTAAPDEEIPTGWRGSEELRAAGARDLTLLHTRDPLDANIESFIQPLREATGVWLPGGRTWRLAEAYLGTRVHEELFALLDRGGVIGGTSAGASIQASFLMRGDPATNRTVFSPAYAVGFGFLRDVAVDQHLITRERQPDLWEVLTAHPELLGIGVDEGTALVVEGDLAEVIGVSEVLLYDASSGVLEPTRFAAGGVFDLEARRPVDRAGLRVGQGEVQGPRPFGAGPARSRISSSDAQGLTARR